MPTLDPARTRYVTIDELAGLLRVSHATIRGLIHRGELPALRVGQRWRIDIADLDRLRAEVVDHD